ncbi:uncharacterized protein CANTADRAFT_26107 [Suhomyces tanzawaensis NRRL Y-17324]|uniref:mRNA decay factor PAT1 domain-containing protein n=1 Tax=Suhomyces tanzawaensis NRRL Y-17324 TaxID=984487 RepID=A0A1E4SHP4_9ASCO|nr:uncharacterized protein CANTADRAFT_26107 [Suhomyces tanzawaensis NRRL Y-17324]ODV79034.1 hypothetical protein CANTADRAFT_26107 [Suhomyces tanzawaensis NRRL Y-17324]
MSFFGFDATGPPSGRHPDQPSESYDFQDTYDGLGEQLDETDDAFNEMTFGGQGDIGKDFSFGNAPHAAQGHGAPAKRAPAPAPPKSGVSYAQVAANDDEFMQDLWGTGNAPNKSEDQAAPNPEKKIMSLEELEAQLTAIDQSQQPLQFPPQPYGMPGMMPPPQFGGYMMPPNGFMPPPGQYGQFPGGPIPQQMPMQPIAGQQVPMPPQQMQQMHHPNIQGQHPHQPQVQTQPQPPQPQQQEAVERVALAQQVPNHVGRVSKADMSQFPVLGSKEAQKFHVNHQPQTGGQAVVEPNQQQVEQPEAHHQHFNQHHHHHQNQQLSQAELSPEQQEKLARRQEKVARIMKYSGIMNPKDKDFVTRFQLSQIVTEDPYNEDFYAQVYKVIHPKSVNNGPQQANQQHNSIAQAYLEQSGHRLGGRYKRADVALQRMQQQVQKAVTVAKERPKLTQYAREGALGKISFGSGKKPRQQLEIFSKAAQREIERKEAEEKGSEAAVEGSTTSFGSLKKDRSPSISAPSKPSKKYSKKDIMSILENIISELMNVESESRNSADVDTTRLWESLRVLEQSSSSGDDEAEVNPFIQCLNYNKALKILLRLFKFLSREQILTIVTLVMSNLENLSVIKNGSYTTYESKKVPDSVLRLVESYSLTFSKVLMNAALYFKFNEIIGLLVILIEHNNVSFVSTTKIGLSILTTLLSRAELIIGEGTISATDLSEWSSCYDELFTSLESRIAAIFPPHPEDVDDGSSRENYVWQFLATLSLGGKLSHQRIIVDEVRDEIFGAMNRAKAIDNSDLANLYKKQNLLNNLNMYLVVMGLVADENEIKELQT